MLTESAVNSINLEPNPHYALGPNGPAKHPLVIKVVREETTRFSKLLSGEVDLVQNGVNLDKLGDFSSRYKELRLSKRPGLKTSYIGFNMKDRYLSNLKVRQAIAHAIDKDAIIKYLLRGMATPANTLLPADHPFFNASLNYPKHAPNKAKMLLDEAGFKKQEGKKYRFRLSYKTTTNPLRVAVGRAIAADLRKVGIDLQVRSQEWGRFKEDVEKGRVQLWGLTWIGFKDPDIYRYAFGTDSWPPNGGNRGRFSHTGLDGVLSKARTSLNPEKRRLLYHEAQKIVAAEAPYVFLFHEENIALMSSRLSGYRVYADGRYAALASTLKSQKK